MIQPLLCQLCHLPASPSSVQMGGDSPTEVLLPDAPTSNARSLGSHQRDCYLFPSCLEMSIGFHGKSLWPWVVSSVAVRVKWYKFHLAVSQQWPCKQLAGCSPVVFSDPGACRPGMSMSLSHAWIHTCSPTTCTRRDRLASRPPWACSTKGHPV